MITKDKLKEYAEKLMFRLEEEQYDTLLREFDVILEQMKLPPWILQTGRSPE